jgi:hypothetical protein
VKEFIDPGEGATTMLIDYLSTTIRPKWESVKDCVVTSESRGDLRIGEG